MDGIIAGGLCFLLAIGEVYERKMYNNRIWKRVLLVV